jgi:hypothetical protein
MPIIRRLIRLGLAFSLLAVAGTATAEVRAWLSQEETGLGEPVTLTLEAEGPSLGHPDLSPLEVDFQILDRRSQHSMQVVNGRRSERSGLTLLLMPRQSGTIRIPPIAFGDEQSPPLTLSVTGEAVDAAATPAAPTWAQPQAAVADPSAEPPEVRLEAELDPAEVRVREQALLVARVLAEGAAHPGGLRDPEGDGARILALGEDRYPLERDGRTWQVYERRYAVFGEEPGRLILGPLEFAGMVGPGGGFGQASSAELRLQVRPIPAGIERADWLPARRLTLSETGPETYRVRPGQTLERIITLTAEGVPSADLPRVGVNVPFQLQRQYTEPRLWDRREPEGIIGTRVDRVLITPREAGLYRLPEERLTWWNTGTGEAETAILPAREVEVAAFARPEDRGTLGTGSLRPEPDPATTAGETGGNPPAAAPEEDPPGTNPWFWISLALAAALAATVLRRRRGPTRRRPPPGPDAEPDRDAGTEPEPADPLAPFIEDVRAAYAAGNATAAREALLAFGAALMPEAPPSNLARLAQRCPEPLRGEILLLEQAFFSPHPVHWEQRPAWTRLRGLTPLPPEEPPSHRRAKPLRRNIAGRRAP